MTNEEYMKHAYSLYKKGVDAEGSMRKSYLKQALNVLENVPDGYPEDVFGTYPSKSDLLSRINGML